MASGSLPSFTVLTEEDDVPGSKFEREPEEYTVGQLKRRLKCRGLKLSGKRDELLKRVSDCITKRESSHARSEYRRWQMVLSKSSQRKCKVTSKL